MEIRCRLVEHGNYSHFFSGIASGEMSMSIVTVYHFRLYDINRCENVTSRHLAPRGVIERLRGEVIENTGVEIDHARLDGNEMILAASLSPR
jgi:hypothetical protein